MLGLKWDHTSDTIVVSRGKSCAITKSLTQRLVLSLVSKVFDPIGFVAPFTVSAILLLKSIWCVTGQQWDDKFPQDKVRRFLRNRVTTPTGEIKTEVAFVLGKARVTTIKVIIVPKLELQAALPAARLKNEIIQAHTVTVNQVFIWTDSTTVLQWINSNEKQSIFVANCVCELLEYTSVDQWIHVATKDNH